MVQIHTEDYMRLPADFKSAWLADLRSGNYTQGTGMLRNGDSFCCLGVAYCTAKGEWDRRDARWSTRIGNRNMLGMSDVPFLVYEVLAQRVAIDHLVNECSIMTILSQMNDDGETFTEIAAWIEENL